jgi:hypothetical protein
MVIIADLSGADDGNPQGRFKARAGHVGG